MIRVVPRRLHGARPGGTPNRVRAVLYGEIVFGFMVFVGLPLSAFRSHWRRAPTRSNFSRAG